MDLAAVEAHNAEVAAKQAAQDAAGRSNALKPGEFEDAASALDKIFLQPDPPAKKEDLVAPQPTPEEKAAAEKAEADKKAAEETAARAAEESKKADEFFKDSPSLPPGASPKSAEAFATIKVKAASEIAAREAKLEELQKKYDELTQRSSTPTTEQLTKDKELNELKEWRAKLDVEFDPRFKQFDAKVAEGEDFIYAQLKKSSVVTDAVIDQIKKFGGPVNSNMSKLFEAIGDPVLQRIVESKIADLTMLKYQKDQALAATKSNITQYLQEREKAFTEATTATQKELSNLLGSLDFMKDKPVEGDETAKKSATDYNNNIARVKGEVAEALKDDSPQMRATLLTAYAKMCYLQDSNKTMQAELESAKKSLAEVTEKFNAVKKSSTSRLRESGAPASGNLPKPQNSPSVFSKTEDNLDALARQVMEQRAAAAK
jgi:hypothetical protein